MSRVAPGFMVKQVEAVEAEGPARRRDDGADSRLRMPEFAALTLWSLPMASRPGAPADIGEVKPDRDQDAEDEPHERRPVDRYRHRRAFVEVGRGHQRQAAKRQDQPNPEISAAATLDQYW